MTFRFRGTGNNDGFADQGMIAGLRAYWEALREDGALPRRHQIDPQGMAGALEHGFLIERVGAGLARFRIAGLAFHDLMGMDVRGIPFSCLFLGEARMPLQIELERVFHAPSILTMDLASPGHFARADLRARLIVLPLAGGAERSDLASGCLETPGPSGRGPRRFAIADSRQERVMLPDRAPQAPHSPAVVWSAPARPVPASLARPGFAEAPGSAPVGSRPRAAGGHLRLVHSND